MIRFKVKPASVRMSVSSPSVGFRVGDAVVVRTDHEPYDGPYEVTPKADEQQTLQTAQKLMLDDVTVKAIPIYNVSNTAGGSTFYIATMDNDPEGGRAILGKARLGAMAL